MTGPEHYQEAERFNGYAEEIYREQNDPEFLAAGQLAAAIAANHATMALAAATVNAAPHDEMAYTAAEAWAAVLRNEAKTGSPS
jgi:hypothetical protein